MLEIGNGITLCTDCQPTGARDPHRLLAPWIADLAAVGVADRSWNLAQWATLVCPRSRCSCHSSMNETSELATTTSPTVSKC